MNLQQLRQKIDALDAKIVALLNDRAAITLAVGKEKIKRKQSIYAPHREQEVLRRIKAINRGPMKPEAFERSEEHTSELQSQR